MAVKTDDAKPEEKDEEKKEGEGDKEKEDGEKKQQRRGQKRKMNEDEPFVVVEEEPEIDDDALCLDWYNSDLYLKISKDNFMVAEPFFKEVRHGSCVVSTITGCNSVGCRLGAFRPTKSTKSVTEH